MSKGRRGKGKEQRAGSLEHGAGSKRAWRGEQGGDKGKRVRGKAWSTEQGAKGKEPSGKNRANRKEHIEHIAEDLNFLFMRCLCSMWLNRNKSDFLQEVTEITEMS
jgi:hypothetical protein